MGNAGIDPMARLVAESEIRNLVAHIGHLADDGDIDEYLSYFTEDASWGTEGGAVRQGHPDLKARVLEHRESGVQGPGAASRHLNTTLWVEVDDEDHAHAESYFLYLTDANAGVAGPAGDPDKGPKVRVTGRYRDTFRRTPDGWKMASRRIVHEVN